MKRLFFVLIAILCSSVAMADSILFESFEYANHDGEPPVGWTCNDNSWVCGYLEKDHNRIAHHGNWYAYTNADESWMFMEFYMNPELKYRFSYWAISDGEYDVEVWAGSAPDVDNMTTMLYTAHVNSGTYEKISEYIDSISDEYQYFGIHAIASSGAYYLTIDEFNVDLVSKYSFVATPTNAYTTMSPGTSTEYTFKVQNTGYESIIVLIFPSSEHFSDFRFFVNGEQCTDFPLEPDEIQHVTAVATLSPSVAIGATCWFDLHLELDCSCASSMTTLWATVVDPTELVEQEIEENVLKVETFDLTGKKVDPANLKAGIYIERTFSDKGVSTKKILKE